MGARWEGVVLRLNCHFLSTCKSDMYKYALVKRCFLFVSG